MLEPSWYPNARQLRQFALISLIGFGVLGFVFWYRFASVQVAIALWAIGAVICAVGLPFPNAIRLVYVLLIGITLPIGWLISNLLLRIIFYGMFTPLGWLFRLLGRDPLILKRPEGPTFWREYEQPEDVSSYYRQG